MNFTVFFFFLSVMMNLLVKGPCRQNVIQPMTLGLGEMKSLLCVFSRVRVLLLVCHLGAGGAKENTVISFSPSGPPPFCQHQTGRLSETPPKAAHTAHNSVYVQPA